MLLGLSRLESRRNRSDLIETFKIVNGHCNVNTNLFYASAPIGNRH